MGAVLATITGGAAPSFVGLALAAPALILAVACNLVAQHAVAAASFCIRDARSSWFLYQKVVFILGGRVSPVKWCRSA